MLNCNTFNKTINFYDNCVNQCPEQYYSITDPIRQIQTCSKCSDQNNICVCSDQSKYFDNIQLKCIQNPSYKDCDKLSQFSPKCEQCEQGFLNYSGTCVYCGNGKYVVSDNLCYGQCADGCFYCSNSTTCHSYDDDMPCYLTCSSCSKPQSQNSCLGCISATRQLNNITNYCDCISGYEESGNVDCNKIKDPVSNSQLNCINILFQVSLYMQLPLIFLPIYTYLHYSFLLGQQIGIIGLLQGVDGNYAFGSSEQFIQQLSYQYLNISIDLNKYKKYSLFLWVTVELPQVVFKTFIDKKQSLFVISSEVLNIMILSLNMIILKCQNQEQYNKFIYYSPTALDIVLISTLILHQLISILSSLYSYYNIFKQIQKYRKQQSSLNHNHQNNMNCFPKEFDISTISQILEQSGKFSKRFEGQNKRI
ncbi:hypothetical protein ABPG73_022361 [Tetrahymena malaccensis]